MFDLSHQLEPSITVYPGDPTFKSECHASIEKDGYNVLQLHLGTHTGTHIDAPSHFIKGGATIEQLPLDMLVGRAIILDVSSKGAREEIKWNDISISAEKIKKGDIVVFKTGWSRYWKTDKYFEHPYLTREVTENLLSKGVRVVCVDTLNPDRTPPIDGQEAEEDSDWAAHNLILGAGGAIVENLTNLESLPEGIDCINISLLPINIAGADGAPIRAVAWRSDDVA